MTSGGRALSSMLLKAALLGPDFPAAEVLAAPLVPLQGSRSFSWGPVAC